MKVVGGAMLLAAGCGTTPVREGSVMLLREDDSAMPSRRVDSVMLLGPTAVARSHSDHYRVWCEANDGGVTPLSSGRVGVKPTTLV